MFKTHFQRALSNCVVFSGVITSGSNSKPALVFVVRDSKDKIAQATDFNNTSIVIASNGCTNIKVSPINTSSFAVEFSDSQSMFILQMQSITTIGGIYVAHNILESLERSFQLKTSTRGGF